MIDIILPVYNSYHHVYACLTSLKNNIHEPYNLIIIDDCSHPATYRALQHFVEEELDENVKLVRNDKNLGYLDTVNKAIKLGISETVVLLNSDTMVFPGTLQKVEEAFDSDSNIGVVTAVSTWANWTKIPFPEGHTCYELNKVIDESDLFDGVVDIKNASGFFFATRRSLFEEVGFFDEVYRPGYYEEADFCMQVLKAGKRVVVHKGLYVFHHGWGSFGGESRNVNMDRNGRTFYAKWGDEYRELERWWKENDPLCLQKEFLVSLSDDSSVNGRAFKPSRETVGELIRSIEANPAAYAPDNSHPIPLHRKQKVIYVLPSLELYGGVISVIQIVNNLILQGVDANIAVSGPISDTLMRSYPLYFRPYVYEDIYELVSNLPECDIAVATSWHTAIPLVAARELHGVRLAYFVQDFEPEFYPENSDLYNQAMATYTLISDRIAKSKWLIDRLEHFGGDNYQIPLGLNLDIFNDHEEPRPLQILAHARPSSPYRNYPMLVEVYKKLSTILPECTLAVFGRGYDVADFGVEIKDYGKLSSPKDVAAAMNDSTILLDPSTFQGFGRPGLEAMACGTAAVLTRNGGITEYAKHRFNALLVNPESLQEIVERVVELAKDKQLRTRLIENGKKSVLSYDYRLEGKRTARVFDEMRASTIQTMQVAL